MIVWSYKMRYGMVGWVTEMGVRRLVRGGRWLRQLGKGRGLEKKEEEGEGNACASTGKVSVVISNTSASIGRMLQAVAMFLAVPT